MLRFNPQNFYSLCDELAGRDKSLQTIIDEYSYPPLWTRPSTFATLVLIILEQQVSLASAYAAFKKLKDKVKRITPANVLLLSDEELRSCYFSRQKMGYVRGLAQAVLSKQINLKRYENESDENIRKELKALKGIGDWSVDIYLIHSLQHADVFPIGDLALVNAVRMVKDKALTKEEILKLSERWKPYRTVATMILWHYYIKRKNIKLLH